MLRRAAPCFRHRTGKRNLCCSAQVTSGLAPLFWITRLSRMLTSAFSTLLLSLLAYAVVSSSTTPADLTGSKEGSQGGRTVSAHKGFPWSGQILTAGRQQEFALNSQFFHLKHVIWVPHRDLHSPAGLPAALPPRRAETRAQVQRAQAESRQVIWRNPGKIHSLSAAFSTHRASPRKSEAKPSHRRQQQIKAGGELLCDKRKLCFHHLWLKAAGREHAGTPG